jgi:hypothetical protein
MRLYVICVACILHLFHVFFIRWLNLVEIFVLFGSPGWSWATFLLIFCILDIIKVT